MRNGVAMKRALFAIVFLSLPALAVAALPRLDDVRNSDGTPATDTVNPLLFNAVNRTVALELTCRTNCIPKASATGAN
jgi:hypothetical protein